MASDPPQETPGGDPRAPRPPATSATAGAQPLVERVLSGADPQLALLAARGLLPLPPERLVPLQVRLADGDAPAPAEAAAAALRQLDAALIGPYLERAAPEPVLAWFVRHSRNPKLLAVVIRRRDVPRRLLVELAPRLPPDLQEALVLRQDAIVEEPAIVDALEANPDLTPYLRRRLAEYRRHLLPRHRVEEPEPLDEPFADEPDEAQVAVAVAAAREHPERGERDPGTGLTEAQIRFLPIPVRMKMTRGTPRALRQILVRDPNPTVALAVLRNNRWSEQEIEQVAHNRNVEGEVLAAIAGDREWASKYRVVVALVHNPRTPLPLAVRLVPRLGVRELRLLSRNRNVPDPVRSTAHRLYTIKRV
jgi:hypothetical protein